MAEKLDKQIFIDVSKNIFDEFYKGNLEPWFSHLCSSSVYIGNGSAILFGKDAIVREFSRYENVHETDVLRAEYFANLLGDKCCQVYGQFILGTGDSLFQAMSRFTITYKMIRGKPVILTLHNSYEIKKHEVKALSKTLNIDRDLLLFMQEILIREPVKERIPVKSGTQTILVNPAIVLYVESDGKKCDIVCIDHVISCNMSFKEILSIAPEYFYQVHRSFLVNTRFISCIRRFEVELITGKIIPIPEKNYTKIRKELESMHYEKNNHKR